MTASDRIEFVPTTPDGCSSVIEHERKLTALADALDQKALSMLEGDVRIGLATAKEIAAQAIRARHRSAELAFKRERRQFVIEREQRLADRANRDREPLPRPPLRRKGSTP